MHAFVLVLIHLCKAASDPVASLTDPGSHSTRPSARRMRNLYSSSDSEGRYDATVHLDSNQFAAELDRYKSARYHGKSCSDVVRLRALSVFQFPSESDAPMIFTVSPGLVCGTLIRNKQGTLPKSA